MSTLRRESLAGMRAAELLRSALLGGACLAALMSVPAAAQEAADGTVETVVVTGLRGSLQHNLDIKRDADGLLDAISAEDLGKFPDSDLAAAMQRIPGVSVSRGVSSLGSTGAPTSTGAATEITVRGFGPTFNETLYDGRQVSTAIGSRGFDFSAVSADFVSEIDILKSPDSSLSAGAIGATVNIKFPKPFDSPGLKLVGSFSGSYSPESGQPAPSGDVLFSDTFANDTIGVLVDFAYTDNRTRSNHVNIQGWEGSTFAPSQFAGAAPGASTTPSVNGWAIQDYGVYQEHTNEVRENGRLVLQWRPVDALEFTLNDNYSRDNLKQNQYGYSVWFNQGSLQDIVANSDGTLVSFNQPGTPTDFQGQINASVIQNNETGFNAKWTVNDKLSATFDADFAESWLNPGGQLTYIDADVGYGPSGAGGLFGTDVGIAGVGINKLPYPTSIGPNGNTADFLGAGIIGSHVLPIGSTRNYDQVGQARLEGAWTEQHLQLRFGVSYVSDRESLSEYDDFANNDWQAYSGYGPASGNIGPGRGVTLPQGLFTQSFSTSGFINGFGNNGNLPAQILQFNPLAVQSYLQSLGNPQTTVIPGANTTCCSPPFDGVYRIVLSPGSYRKIYEETLAAYVTLAMQTSLGGMPLKINLGAREETTSVNSSGLGQLPQTFTVQSGDHTAFNINYFPATLQTGTNRYTHLLPNLDLALQVTDDLQLRLDASRTLTKPPLADLTPVPSVTASRVGDVAATSGNPDLMPYTSDNIDISAEYYYAPNSYVAIDGFTKYVDNFIVNGSTQETFAGVTDPTTGADVSYTLTAPVNGPSAKVYGLELALQHVFDDSGWGFQANATLVGTNKPYNPNDLSVSGFAVTGLANSANLVGFYDKDGFQARVAANWRASYLDHFGQLQNGSKFGIEPTFVNSTIQVDFSTSYDITENVNVFFEALNLNDATYSTHGRFKEQLLDAVDYGRSFRLGVHWKL
ncbi:MAG: TonB-dependent receptor [Rhizomicrobium sp.]